MQRSEFSQKVHTLNNLLNIIHGYSELLLLDTPPEDERCELLRAILRASAQASAVTAALPGQS